MNCYFVKKLVILAVLLLLLLLLLSVMVVVVVVVDNIRDSEDDLCVFHWTCLVGRCEVSEFYGTASRQQSPTHGTKFVALRQAIQPRRRGSDMAGGVNVALSFCR